MEKDLLKILQIITDAPEQFIKQLSKTEQAIYAKVLGIIKELDIDASGNIRSSTANLKRLNEIKKQLGNSLLYKEYLNSVKNYVKQFQVIAALQNGLFDAKKTISKTITDVAIDNTLETLTGKGYTETIISKLREIIQTSIVSGGSFKDLTVDLDKLITGDNDTQSVIRRQVQTPVVDALSIFSAEHTKLVTDDLGYEWYMYVGSNKTTTRELCEHLTLKKYIHISEIPKIVTGLIDGHQCKLGKNGLPLGMFEGTTADNFQVNRGGYNCGHQLYPISGSQVPFNLRIKFEPNLGKEAREEEYERLKKNPEYNNVHFNEDGGVMATHKDHSFDPNRGHYEKEAQKILFDNGNVIVFEGEKGPSGERFADGYLNGLKTDIKTVEGIGKNNIKNKLNEAMSQGAESVVLYFPKNELFSIDRIYDGLIKFKGVSKDFEFKEIVYIVDNKVYRLK